VARICSASESRREGGISVANFGYSDLWTSTQVGVISFSWPLRQRSMTMHDDEFLRTFLRGWPAEERFGHYEHLRIAWLVIDRHGPELAAAIVGERLRAMAIAQGKAPLYNETMTRFWIRLIAHVRDAMGPFLGIDEAIARAPFLTDKNLPLRHWSRTAMFGPAARVEWIEPDLVPLPF
ncbi:MAG TPA: hypothetical protein VEU76_03825, partial [Candidatus Udaeobacter sp.]|nr:hypothetical protein [Candidatus Udaeobacter sp.]